MLIAAVVFAACQILVFSCLAAAGWLWYGREKARIQQQLVDLVRSLTEPPDDKTPSALAVLMDQLALVLAARLVQQLKAMLAGTESGLSKQETGQLELDLGQTNPWLGILAGILPKRIRNQMLRNPQMVGALANMVKGSGDQAGQAGNNGQGGPGASVRERISRSH